MLFLKQPNPKDMEGGYVLGSSASKDPDSSTGFMFCWRIWDQEGTPQNRTQTPVQMLRHEYELNKSTSLII